VSEPLLWVDDCARDPESNMALDEASLAGDGARLRTYGWQPHAISLGYFQKLDDFADLPPDLPRVRRVTGGGAILHADELTVALALPDRLLSGTISESYASLNGAVIRAVRRHGHELRAAAPAQADRSRWCFAAPTGLDLVDRNARKVFGSAQRRRGGRVLWHGSLILGRHELTPFTGELPGVRATEVAESLATEVADVLGLRLVRGSRDLLPLVHVEEQLAAAPTHVEPQHPPAVPVEHEDLLARGADARRSR